MISRKSDSFCCHSFMLRSVLLLHVLYLADFGLAACDFVGFHLIEVLKENVNFSFNICDTLPDLVPFVQFKELEYPLGRVTFNKGAR